MISVIIPVYNVNEWLGQTLDSVLAQSWGDWELILVDDGSSDGSGRICDRYASKDSRISVIHQKNGGPSEARNAGLEMARGSEIAFIDSDDYIPPHYLETLSAALEETGADAVCVKMRRFIGSGREAVVSWKKDSGKRYEEKPSIIGPEEAVNQILYQDGYVDASPCGKLYRRALWEGMRFTSGILYEDLDLIYRVLARAQCIAVTTATEYFYRITPGSILHKVEPYRGDVLKVTRRIVDDLAGTPLEEAARARQLSANFNILGLIEAHPGPLDGFGDECRRIISEYPLGRILRGRLRMKDRVGLLVYRLLGPKIFSGVARRFYR